MKTYKMIDDAIKDVHGQEVYNQFNMYKMETVAYLDNLKYIDIGVDGKYIGYYHTESGWVYVSDFDFEVLFKQINGYSLSDYFENKMY